MKEMSFSEEMARYSELLQQRSFAYSEAWKRGFRPLSTRTVNPMLGAAKRLMQEAGFSVCERSVDMPPFVMVAQSEEAKAYLAERQAHGTYSWGVCLVKDELMDDVMVHELVHHLQGLWTQDMPSDKSIPYQQRWEESQAFLIQRAYREERNPRSFIVRLKHIWSGFTVPCCD